MPLCDSSHWSNAHSRFNQDHWRQRNTVHVPSSEGHIQVERGDHEQSSYLSKGEPCIAMEATQSRTNGEEVSESYQYFEASQHFETSQGHIEAKEEVSIFNQIRKADLPKSQNEANRRGNDISESHQRIVLSLRT